MIESRLSRCSTRHRASIAKLGATLMDLKGDMGPSGRRSCLVMKPNKRYKSESTF